MQLLKLSFTILLIAIPLSIALCQSSEFSVNTKVWNIGCHMQCEISGNKNFVKGLELFEEIQDLDSIAAKRYYKHAALCYDKVGQMNQSLDLMKVMYEDGDSSFCIKIYDKEREYSSALTGIPEFTKLCPVYDYGINFPCDYPSFRDSLIKYYIYSSNLEVKGSLYIKMGKDHLYPTDEPTLNKSRVERILESEHKIDSLVSIYGCPTLDKVRDVWVEALFHASIVHSLTEGRIEYYIKNHYDYIPKRIIAKMKDKISVRNNEPQLYGSQFNVVNGKLELYPTYNIDSLDIRRAEMRMLPFDLYQKELGIHQKEMTGEN